MSEVRTNKQSLWSKAFNLPVLQKSRLPWVDYLRGIAILLVVYRHVKVGLERSQFAIPAFVENANMIFFSFRMPLFFILSGIFISGSLAKKSVTKLISNKFETLLYPYLIWAFIQITLQILLAGSTNSDRTPEQYAWIIYQPRGLDQFWYLPALFNSTVIFLFTRTKLHFTSWMQLLFGITVYFLCPYFRAVSMISDWMEFYLFFALGDFISSFFFRKNVQDMLKKNLTLIIAIPLFVASQLYYLEQPTEYYRHVLKDATRYYTDEVVGQIQFLPIVFIGCFSMCVLAFRLQQLNILRFLRVLGYHSLYIYVMHVIVSAFVRIVLTKALGIDNLYILLLCGIAAGVVIPVVVYNLLIRDNIAWFLFTYKKPKKKPLAEMTLKEAVVTE